jgi:hypothetical protein
MFGKFMQVILQVVCKLNLQVTCKRCLQFSARCLQATKERSPPSVTGDLVPLSFSWYRQPMPKDELTLADVSEPYLVVACEPCGRRGRYAVSRLIEQFGDTNLPAIKVELTKCPKARVLNFRDVCRARFERPRL